MKSGIALTTMLLSVGFLLIAQLQQRFIAADTIAAGECGRSIEFQVEFTDGYIWLLDPTCTSGFQVNGQDVSCESGNYYGGFHIGRNTIRLPCESASAFLISNSQDHWTSVAFARYMNTSSLLTAFVSLLFLGLSWRHKGRISVSRTRSPSRGAS